MRVSEKELNPLRLGTELSSLACFGKPLLGSPQEVFYLPEQGRGILSFLELLGWALSILQENMVAELLLLR